MIQSRIVVALIGLLLLPCCTLAQKNEISFSAGALSTDDQNVAIGDPSGCSFTVPHCQFFDLLTTPNKLALEVSYARRLFAVGPVSLYAEVPLFLDPHHKTNVTPESIFAPGPFTVDGSALFFTPGAKVKVSFPKFPVEPWVSIGGGLAHIHKDAVTLPVDFLPYTNSATRNTGALELGGGLDIKTPLPHLGFRAEYRNFRSGAVFTSDTSHFVFIGPETLHHTFGAAGVVLMF